MRTPYSTHTPAYLQIQPNAKGARNFSQCDSMLIGDRAAANTYPYINVGHGCCLRVRPCSPVSAASSFAWPIAWVPGLDGVLVCSTHVSVRA